MALRTSRMIAARWTVDGKDPNVATPRCVDGCSERLVNS